MVLAASPQPQRRWGVAAAGVGALLLLVVLGLASVAGVIAWAPKWPHWLLPWLFANFFLVSLAEEAFFRAGLQRWLELRTEPFPALMAAAVAFGLVHVAGGWVCGSRHPGRPGLRPGLRRHPPGLVGDAGPCRLQRCAPDSVHLSAADVICPKYLDVKIKTITAAGPNRVKSRL